VRIRLFPKVEREKIEDRLEPARCLCCGMTPRAMARRVVIHGKPTPRQTQEWHLARLERSARLTAPFDGLWKKPGAEFPWGLIKTRVEPKAPADAHESVLSRISSAANAKAAKKILGEAPAEASSGTKRKWYRAVYRREWREAVA
jgi:hypothetical protein